MPIKPSLLLRQWDLIQRGASSDCVWPWWAGQDFPKIFSRAFRSFWSELAPLGFEAPMGLGCRGRFKKTLLSHQTWRPRNRTATSPNANAPCISSACPGSLWHPV